VLIYLKKLLTPLRFALAASLLFVLVQSGAIDWQSMSRLISAWDYTLLAIAFFLLGTILHALRLEVLINASHLQLSFFAAVKLTFIGLFFNTYLPGSTGGDLVKIYYASKGNLGSRAEVVTVLLMDRFVGLFGLITLPILLAPLFVELIAAQVVMQTLLFIAFVVATVIVLSMALSARYPLSDSALMNKFLGKFTFGAVIIRAIDTVQSYKLNSQAIVKALVYSWLHQIFMIGVALAVAEAINPQGASWKMVALIPYGYLANALPITPGGIGVGEAAMQSIFRLNNLDGGAEVLLGWRLVMVIVGLIGLAFYLKGEKRFVFSDKNVGSE
jgi:uncharacterized protein (TIRG00374 family)